MNETHVYFLESLLKADGKYALVSFFSRLTVKILSHFIRGICFALEAVCVWRIIMTIFLELLLMGIGLAMDAFAVAVCKGLAMRKVNRKRAIVIALFFGGFQALMPFIGWMLGRQFEQYITSIDHWIAFVLLGFIGGKMILEALKPGDEDVEIIQMDAPLDIRELLLLSVATSIDALAVGITFAFLQYPVVEAVSVIGITTFFVCIGGVYVGNFFGNKYKNKAEFAGGLILVLLGLRILLSHLGIIG